jgi:hypothetical protein
MLDAIYEAINDLAMGSSGAANRLVLMARMIERYARDRADTHVEYAIGDDGKPYDRHGETLYPNPPGAAS